MPSPLNCRAGSRRSRSPLERPEVNNRFGLNCFVCHVKARPEYDFICETEHGCDPIPVTKAMFGALQRTDLRCPGSGQVSPEDAEALKQLGEIVKALTEKNIARRQRPLLLDGKREAA